MLEQLVGLCFSGLAIVACCGDVEIGREGISFQLCDSRQNMIGDIRRIRSLTLCNRDRDGRNVSEWTSSYR